MNEPEASRAIAAAVGHVNVSMPSAMTTDDLLAALRADPVDPAWTHHLHAVLDETAIEILADLVRSGAVSHVSLLQLARPLLRPDHPTLRWLAARDHRQPSSAPGRHPPCWRTLLAKAQTVLDQATAARVPDPAHPLWVIGGDVAIAHALGHRDPRDLSVCIISMTRLKRGTPGGSRSAAPGS